MHDAPSSGVRWIVLGLIVLASFISYVLRTNMSIVGPTMVADLGMSEVQLGMVLSAFAAGYAIFQLPGGVFGGRFGARFAVAAIAVAWGALTIATGLVPGTGALPIGGVIACLVAVRFLVGVTHAPIFPITGGVTGDWFPVGKWGLPMGLSSTGLTLGAAATPPIVVWLMEAYGWRESFFLTAPAGFALAALWWWYMRDYPKDHPRVSAQELALIEANRTPPGPRRPRAWSAVLRNRDILLLTLSYFCMNYVFYLFFNWFFYYLDEIKGFSSQQAGAFTSAQWIIGAVGATLGGFGCDQLIARFGLRRGPQLLSVASLVLTAIFLAAGATARDPYLAVALLALSFGCTQLTEAAYWAAMIAVAGRDASEAGGVINTGANLAGVVGGLLVPLSAEYFGWVVAVSMGSAFALIGAVLWLFVRGDRPMLEDAARPTR
ncbi:MAG TPA: MFS transporter [Myxococcota bacterium]|nr:MFS transporter [Myxococcota bacterium]